MNWRPIKTAPKYGDEELLLSFTGADGETRYSGVGRWVECPPNGHVMRLWQDGRKDEIKWIEEGHWEVSRVAVLQHGGALNGNSFGPRSWEPYDVTHWMPLPKPARIRSKK